MAAKTITNKYLIIGLAAMLILILGTLAENGSQLQKILFIIGAPTLGITAYANKQKMLTALQLVATLGATIAFFPDVPAVVKYLMMGGAIVLSLAYLTKSKYFATDKFGLIGSIGLASIALGLATNALSSPFLFGIFLGLGGLIVAVYSLIQFVHYNVKIALLWVVLNILFSINPLLMLIK